MIDHIRQNGSELFEEAVAFYQSGDLKSAIDAFMVLAIDDRWFERSVGYLADAIQALKSREVPHSAEWTRLARVESEIDERRKKLARRGPPYLAPASSPSFLRKGMSRRGSLHLATKGPAYTPSTELEKNVGIAKREVEPALSAIHERGDTSSHEVMPRPIERTPHIDVLHSGPAKPGDEFSIRVYLDQIAMREGEAGTNVVGPSGSHVEVILMTSSHFTFSGSGRASFVFNADQETIEVASFDLKVAPEQDWLEGAPSVIAAFFIEGRPCGHVSRNISLMDVPAPDVNAILSKIAIIPHGAPPADLQITVHADPINNDRQFWCTVSTPHLPQFRSGKLGVWNLKNTVSETVQEYMASFTSDATGVDQLIAELRGAGLAFFDAAPQIFRDVFWALIDANAPLKSIAIVTAEPYFPWELMIPRRVVKGIPTERDNPLGVDFSIGRWTDPAVIAPVWKIKLSDSYVIAPDYKGAGDLKSAAEEARMVLDYFKGTKITPASFTQIRTTLLGEARSLIHFICHGESEAVGQTLRLEGTDKLTSTALIGIKGLGDIIRSKQPVVFLNACQVGRTNPALIGVGGFAPAFIQLGASAVIAPLWNVSDDVAHEIAEEFYQSVKKNPSTPFSEIFSKIRAKAYDDVSGRDTYAAYCFFGDPLASAAAD